MGRNKPRSKAVDVTKSLLQPTSVTDYIAVQIGPNVVIQVAEEDLSPTQGSEAAFALRREGKLDTTMKLCLNWRQGNCHNHAACSFAHVARYFGVLGELPAPLTSGRVGGYGTAAGSTYSSVAAGGSAGRSGGGGSGGGSNNASWSQKLAPPSYSSTANRSGSARVDERRGDAAPPSPAPASLTDARSPAAAAVAQAGESATERSAGHTPLSSAVSTPQVRPAAAPPSPVISAEGLRNVLQSLAASQAANAAAAAAAAAPAAAAATAGDGAADSERPAAAALRPSAFLDQLVASAAAADASSPPWPQEMPGAEEAELVTMLGRVIIGDYFSATTGAESLFSRVDRSGRYVLDLHSEGLASRQPTSAAQSPEAEAVAPPPPPAAPSVPPEFVFSTAPATVAMATSGVGQLSVTDIALGAVHGGAGFDDAHLPVSGISYQQLLSDFTADE